MSHDRGCHCGKEPYEYEDCRVVTCGRRRSPLHSEAASLNRDEPAPEHCQDLTAPDPKCNAGGQPLDDHPSPLGFPRRANTMQVGGTHYQRGGLQHWDFVEAHGIGYLEAAASKYLTRWRDKNGVQDLEKARHYTVKLLELHEEGARYQRGTATYQEARQWVQTQDGVDSLTAAALVEVLCWKEAKSLVTAIQIMDRLIEEASR